MKLSLCFFAFLAVTVLASISYAGNCRIDGTDYASTSGTPVHTSTNFKFNGHVCNHTIYASSGTCYLLIDNSDSVGSGNCLAVGLGVQVTTSGGSTISCTGASCGSAIAQGTGGSGNTDYDGLTITGCFTKGVSWGHNLTNSVVDLAGNVGGTPCQGTWGAAGLNLIDTSKFYNASGYGVSATNTVSNTLIENCTSGINGWTSGAVADNVYLINNVNQLSGSGGTLKGSVLESGASTACVCNTTPCSSDVTTCATISGQPSFVDGDIIQ